MSRHLHPDGMAEFLCCHGLGTALESCGSENLGATVWDHYGTVPADDSTEAKAGTGDFLVQEHRHRAISGGASRTFVARHQNRKYS